MDFFYSWILKLFGWNSFLSEQAEVLRAQAAAFQQFFASWGCGIALFVLLAGTFTGVCIYYFVWCNGSSKRFKYRYRLKWWGCWMALTTICIALGTYFVIAIAENNLLANNQLGGEFTFAVSLANFFYSILCFPLFSIAATQLRGKHTNASCTPF